mgnify:CR=1 FL=1
MLLTILEEAWCLASGVAEFKNFWTYVSSSLLIFTSLTPPKASATVLNLIVFKIPNIFDS